MILVFFLYITIAIILIILGITAHKWGKEIQRRGTAENALDAIYERRGGIDEVYHWYRGIYPKDVE